jgi:phosphoglycerate dehydrogenase-like enzyme
MKIAAMSVAVVAKATHSSTNSLNPRDLKGCCRQRLRPRGPALTSETRGLGGTEIASMNRLRFSSALAVVRLSTNRPWFRLLQSGALRGAALDVFTIEPLPAGHPFWTMPNVLLSPHTADHVEGFLIPAFECFMENLKRFLSGLPLSNVVDKHAGY